MLVYRRRLANRSAEESASNSSPTPPTIGRELAVAGNRRIGFVSDVAAGVAGAGAAAALSVCGAAAGAAALSVRGVAAGACRV